MERPKSGPVPFPKSAYPDRKGASRLGPGLTAFAFTNQGITRQSPEAHIALSTPPPKIPRISKKSVSCPKVYLLCLLAILCQAFCDRRKGLYFTEQLCDPEEAFTLPKHFIDQSLFPLLKNFYDPAGLYLT